MRMGRGPRCRATGGSDRLWQCCRIQAPPRARRSRGAAWGRTAPRTLSSRALTLVFNEDYGAQRGMERALHQLRRCEVGSIARASAVAVTLSIIPVHGIPEVRPGD